MSKIIFIAIAGSDAIAFEDREQADEYAELSGNVVVEREVFDHDAGAEFVSMYGG
jgi:hypothetical protein